MAMVPGQGGVIPGAVYGRGTMTTTDLYPQLRAIGGIRSQDYTIPIYADSLARASERSLAIGAAPDHLSLTQPAGWLFLFIVLLVVGVWVIK